MLTKKDKLIFIIGIIAIGTFLIIGRDVKLYNEGKELHAQYEQKLKKEKDRRAENKKIAKQNRTQIAQTNLKPTYESGKKVVKDLFSWSSWNEYKDNMKDITVQFPEVAKNKDIDSKAQMIGSGKSPISQVEVDTTATGVGATNNQVSFYVKQILTYPDEKYEKDWYLCFEGSGKDLKLVGYYPLEKLHTNEEKPE